MDRSDLRGSLRTTPAGQRVITALDVPTGSEAIELARSLGSGPHVVKVGLKLFSAAGPEVVR